LKTKLDAIALAAAGFTLVLVCLLGMGAAAQGEQTIARQWMEQSINTFGQLGFAAGSYLLCRSFAAHTSEPRPGPAGGAVEPRAAAPEVVDY